MNTIITNPHPSVQLEIQLSVPVQIISDGPVGM